MRKEGHAPIWLSDRVRLRGVTIDLRCFTARAKSFDRLAEAFGHLRLIPWHGVDLDEWLVWDAGDGGR